MEESQDLFTEKLSNPGTGENFTGVLARWDGAASFGLPSVPHLLKYLADHPELRRLKRVSQPDLTVILRVCDIPRIEFLRVARGDPDGIADIELILKVLRGSGLTMTLN